MSTITGHILMEIICKAYIEGREGYNAKILQASVALKGNKYPFVFDLSRRTYPYSIFKPHAEWLPDYTRPESLTVRNRHNAYAKLEFNDDSNPSKEIRLGLCYLWR